MSILLLIKISCCVVTSVLTFIFFLRFTTEIHSQGDELALEEINNPTDQGIIH